jgi:hypothetical protein
MFVCKQRVLRLTFFIMSWVAAAAQISFPVSQPALITFGDAVASPKVSGRANRPKLDPSVAVMWREPTDIKTRDLFYGQAARIAFPRDT